MSATGPKRVQEDIQWDHVPIASMLTNLTDIYQKYIYSGQDTTLMDYDERVYVQHIQSKSALRIALCYLPFLGNAILYLYDRYRPPKIAPEAFSPIDPTTLPTVFPINPEPRTFNLSSIKKSYTPGLLHFTDRQKRRIQVPFSGILLQSFQLNPPVDPNWKQNPAKYLELFNDNGHLKMRRITESNYNELKLLNPTKSGTLIIQGFGHSLNENSYLLEVKTPQHLTIFNDRTKQYLKIPLDPVYGYQSHNYTDFGLIITYKLPTRPQTPQKDHPLQQSPPPNSNDIDL